MIRIPTFLMAVVHSHHSRLGNYLKRSAFFMLFFLALAGVHGQGGSSWSSFRGGQNLQGKSTARLGDHPRKLWKFEVGDNIKSAPVIDQGRVVVGATNGTVYCLDLKGSLKWKFKTENSFEAPALILNGIVYIGNLDGTFYALKLTDGSLVWKYKTDNQIMGSANFWKSGSKTLLMVGSYDYFLHCVDAETGKVVWKYESDNFINGAAACYNGQALFGGCDGYLHVVNIKTGKLDYKINVATYVASSSPVNDQGIFIGDYDGKISRIDLKSRKTIWSWDNKEQKQPFIASAALSDNRIVTGSRDKMVYCFDAADGKLFWKYNTGNRVEASPVVIGDRVLVANMRGDLSLLRLSDGSQVWKYELGNAVLHNPAVIDHLFVSCSLDGTITAFGD